MPTPQKASYLRLIVVIVLRVLLGIGVVLTLTDWLPGANGIPAAIAAVQE